MNLKERWKNILWWILNSSTVFTFVWTPLICLLFMTPILYIAWLAGTELGQVLNK
jgi:hypothetical protein